MNKNINLINSSVGNVGSVIRVLNDLKYKVNLVDNPNQIDPECKIIMPGVGNYDKFLKSLKEKGLFDRIKKFILIDKVKILGICVGMQSIFESSEEGVEKGFGFIHGKCVKFKPGILKIPHIGWNNLIIKKESNLLKNLKKKEFYFAHSYHVNLDIDQNNIIANTDYCYHFPSIINYKNIFGVQFHPEKSFDQGAQIIKNFLEHC